jgi:hypothetical protein
MTLHFGAVLIAIVGVLGIMTFKAVRDDPMRFTDVASPRKLPEHKLDPAGIAVTGPPQLAPDYVSVVLTFVTDEQARAAANQAFLETGSDAVPTRRITRIANALIVSFDASDSAAREQILSRWEHQAADAFVESDKYRAMVTLTCVAPSIARADSMESELSGYFSLRYYGQPIPPWADQDVWPPQRRSADEAARQLLARLQKGPEIDFNSAELKQMNADSIAAVRKGDRATVERISKQRQELVNQAKEQFRRQMLAENPDSQLTATWFRVNDEKDYRKLRELMKSQIGPLIGNWPADRPAHTLALGGYASRKLDQLQLHYLQFMHVDAGLPVLVRWLASQGCGDFKFEITGTNSYSDEQLDEEE